MPRIILHIDMNSYFASVEQQANPFLRGKPIGVTGKRKERTVVAAASREAKRLGVKTAMATWEAKRTLPSVILVPGDPEKYGDITRRFNAIFREVTDKVEPFSVDESFLDVTEEARDYLGAVVIAQNIKRRLREECGEYVTASVGIAPNKPMAKLASERVKPNGLVTAPPDRVISLLDESALEDVCGIGPRTASRLRELGICTFAHLREYPREQLEREFHAYGIWLHEIAHGRGNDEVATEVTSQKSYGHSYTLPSNSADPNVVRRYLLIQCDKVAWQMRRDGFSARCVTAYLRYGDFRHDAKQCRVQEPANDGLVLFNVAWSLIEPFVIRRPPRPVRLVGISASELSPRREQDCLFQKERSMSSVLRALDRLQERYGPRAWTRGSLLQMNVDAHKKVSG